MSKIASFAEHRSVIDRAVERARDNERLSIIKWLEKWSEGRDFTEQGVASLILKDLLDGK